MVTLVSKVQPENVLGPIVVTGQPPSLAGTYTAPIVDIGTAVDDDASPPTVAQPSNTVYVHVIPSIVSVAALKENIPITTKESTHSFLISTFPLPALCFTAHSLAQEKEVACFLNHHVLSEASPNAFE
jgi:hypothetical protein